jgi:hypothetical protein
MIPNWLSKFSALLPRVVGLAAIISSAVAMGTSAADAQSSVAQITVLYDAFGNKLDDEERLGILCTDRV